MGSEGVSVCPEGGDVLEDGERLGESEAPLCLAPRQVEGGCCQIAFDDVPVSVEALLDACRLRQRGVQVKAARAGIQAGGLMLQGLLGVLGLLCSGSDDTWQSCWACWACWAHLFCCWA